MKKHCQGHFCSNPFEQAIVDEYGDVFLCCQSWLPHPIGNLLEHSWEEVWNSPWAQEIRATILDGSYTFCSEINCPYLQGQPGRFKPIEEVTDPYFKEIIEKGMTALPRGPSTVFISYDPTCNLACPSCRCGYVVAKGETFDKIKIIHDKVWDHAMDDAEILYVTGMGDPFSSRLYRKILREFDHTRFPKLDIALITNGLLLTPAMWESIRASHSAIQSINISVNAGKEETFLINQEGGSWQKLLDNLAFVKELRARNEINFFGFNYFVHENNFREMKGFVEFGKSYGADMITFANMQNWGTYSDEDFARIAVHLKGHPCHEEFCEILQDPIFRDPVCRMGNLSALLPGAHAPSPIEGLMDKSPTTLDELAAWLIMDEAQKAQLRAIVDKAKEDGAEILSRTPQSGNLSALAFLAQLQAAQAPDAGAQFEAYAWQEIDPESGLPYLQAIQRIDQEGKTAIGALLAPKQRHALPLVFDGPLQELVTGVDPIGQRVHRLMSSLAAPSQPAETSPKELVALCQHLALTAEESERLAVAVSALRSYFAALAEKPARNGQPSPAQHLAQALHAKRSDAYDIFSQYIETAIEGESGETYAALLEAFDGARRRELEAHWRPEAWHRFESLSMPLLSIEAQADPFGQMIERRLQKMGAGATAQGGTQAGAQKASLAVLKEKLALSDEQNEKIFAVLRDFRDAFTALYLRPPGAGKAAPAAILAEALLRKDPAAQKAFLAYAGRERDMETGMTYLRASQLLEKAAREKLEQPLSGQQREQLGQWLPASLLDVAIGYDPFGDALKAHMQRAAMPTP